MASPISMPCLQYSVCFPATAFLSSLSIIEPQTPKTSAWCCTLGLRLCHVMCLLTPDMPQQGGNAGKDSQAVIGLLLIVLLGNCVATLLRHVRLVSQVG